MEYLTQYLLLKQYAVVGNQIKFIDPLACQGFAEIKKEQNNYSLSIQTNVSAVSRVIVASYNNIFETQICGRFLSVRLNFAIDKTNAIILLPDCSLVATASSANIVLSGAVLQKILPNHTTNLQIGTSHDATKLQTTPNLGEQTQANSKYPELETIFGKRVLSTIFFDQIKGKLAKVFLLGTPCKALNKFFVNSKWVEAMLENKPMFVGVIYKDNFAYAVGVGENVTNLLATTMPPNYYQIEDKTYKIDFFSAESGKTISRICQN